MVTDKVGFSEHVCEKLLVKNGVDEEDRCFDKDAVKNGEDVAVRLGENEQDNVSSRELEAENLSLAEKLRDNVP